MLPDAARVIDKSTGTDEKELIEGESVAFTADEWMAWLDLKAFVAGEASAPTRERALEAYVTLGAWLARIKSVDGAGEETVDAEGREV